MSPGPLDFPKEQSNHKQWIPWLKKQADEACDKLHPAKEMVSIRSPDSKWNKINRKLSSQDRRLLPVLVKEQRHKLMRMLAGM